MRRPRFHFTLDSVRSVRKHSEDLAMQALATELAEAGRVASQLGDAQQRLAAAQQDGFGALGALELAQQQLYRERIEREVEAARIQASLQARAVQDARDRLDAAARQREVLDKLEDRQRAEHAQEVDRAERVASDAIAVSTSSNGFGSIATGTAQ